MRVIALFFISHSSFFGIFICFVQFTQYLSEVLFFLLTSHSIYEMLSRLSAKAISRRAHQSVRTFASVEKTSSGPLGDDGRHEIWRGDVDHDNEPKVRFIFGSLCERVLMLISSSQIGFLLNEQIFL